MARPWPADFEAVVSDILRAESAIATLSHEFRSLLNHVDASLLRGWFLRGFKAQVPAYFDQLGVVGLVLANADKKLAKIPTGAGGGGGGGGGERGGKEKWTGVFPRRRRRKTAVLQERTKGLKWWVDKAARRIQTLQSQAQLLGKELEDAMHMEAD